MMTSFKKIAAGTVCVASLMTALPALAEGPLADDPSWTPRASERLVKLPASYLQKTIDHDFVDSQLGQALSQTEENIGLKGQTLGDLKKAVEEAPSAALQMELRHQFLAEKRAFVELMGRKNDLRRKHVETKLTLFEDMMKNLAHTKGADSPARAALIAKQDAARTRFASSLGKVDMQLFETRNVPESKYAVKYAENLQAIEQLLNGISNHEGSRAALSDDGTPLSKEEHVRRMMTETQAELALLNQENTILGYMAKLVALDALALSEKAMDAELADSTLPGSVSTASAVGYFLGN